MFNAQQIIFGPSTVFDDIFVIMGKNSKESRKYLFKSKVSTIFSLFLPI